MSHKPLWFNKADWHLY